LLLMSGFDLTAFKSTIVARFPDLAGSDFSLLTRGFHSIAVDVDDRLIFKFPRHAEAERALRTETRLLTVVRPIVSMRVPDLTLFEGPPLFSRHTKIRGEHLLAADYGRLPDKARQRLATEMARFYAELHALDHSVMAAAGAGPVGSWQQPDNVLREVWPTLPEGLRPLAERAIGAYQAMPPDPHGSTYGFFDGHGWNMAFDHAGEKLNGVYDFADSGFGALHQEFVYTNFIARDLTLRIVRAYEDITSRALDRERIDLLTGVFWLSELAGFANDPEQRPDALKNVAEWATW